MRKDYKNKTQIVKEKLWKFGYSVKYYPEEEIPFDLMVEKKYRVLVGSAMPKALQDCDIFAVVRGKEVRFVREEGVGNMVKYISPYDVFGKI